MTPADHGFQLFDVPNKLPAHNVIPYLCECGHAGTHKRPWRHAVHQAQPETCGNCGRQFEIRVVGARQ